jgi:hypothetical protein
MQAEEKWDSIYIPNSSQWCTKGGNLYIVGIKATSDSSQNFLAICYELDKLPIFGVVLLGTQPSLL